MSIFQKIKSLHLPKRMLFPQSRFYSFQPRKALHVVQGLFRLKFALMGLLQYDWKYAFLIASHAQIEAVYQRT